MSSLTYQNAYDFGQVLSDTTHYSQSVLIPTSPPTLKLSGQGGWDPSTGAIDSPTTREALVAQIEQAFVNVQMVLKASKASWQDVYLVRAYMVGQEDGIVEMFGEALKKWCPNHRPVLTGVEVKGLALEGMRVEIEVEALIKG